MLIDKFMPGFDIHEVHTISIRATPDEIWRAVKELRAAEIPLVRILFALRAIPALLTGQRYRSKGDGGTVLEQMQRGSFIQLAETQGRELVVGTVGRFWQINGGMLKLDDAEQFVEFRRPDYARATMNFSLHKSRKPGRTRLRTETRVLVPDAAARRKFALYWRVVYPGSALIRVMWLLAIKRRAEQASRI